MVVLAIAICSRSGAVILSRHFLPVSKQRIETLLAQFPRLLQSNQQHTTVETDQVRFLYQPLESSQYLVLVTSKASNILQDMETLALCGRAVAEQTSLPVLVPGGAGATAEEAAAAAINERLFEIILAFDELVTSRLGLREHVTLSQLHTVLEMESQEELIQEIIAKNKMQEAKEASKRKIKQMEMEKKEAAAAARRASRGYPGASGTAGGFDGGSGYIAPLKTGGSPVLNTLPGAAPAVETVLRAGGKGMKLGKKSAAIID